MVDPSNAGVKPGFSPNNRSNLLDRYGVDAAVALALFLIAVLIRIPYLSLIPVWADDMGESNVALLISEGAVSPLVTMAGYTGPVHPDLVALALKVVEDPLVPRSVNLVLASLTVAATYFLGLSLRNRAAGVIAALLLATSSTHIVVNSHYAYSSVSTPLFATMACLLLVLATKRNSVWLLGSAGVALALAMQTHPVAVALAPGLLIWFLLRPNLRSWLRRPGLYLAALAAVAAYAPVLYAAYSDFAGFRLSVVSRRYAFETNHSLFAYLGNLQNLMVEVLRMLGAHYFEAARPLLYLTDPLVLAYAILVPLATLVSLRPGRTLATLTLASAALIIPYFNNQYGAFPYFTRYVALLLPILYASVALLVVQVWDWFSTPSLFRSRLVRATGFETNHSLKVSTTLLVAALIVLPAYRTFEYYDRQSRLGASNASFLEIVQRVDSDQDAPVLIDASLKAGEFPGGGNLTRSFRIWFRFQHRQYALVDAVNQPIGEVCGANKSLLIAATSAAAALSVDCLMVRLLDYNIPTRPGRDRLEYGLYEIGPPAR